MSSAPVIVFGATGDVGSFVAKHAASNGSKVILAVRDLNKPISALDEKSGNFQRVQADLTKPDTVTEAVKSTGAKRAFFYMVHGGPELARPAVEALKAGGIEFIAFLSSASVIPETKEDLAKLTPADGFIPWIHAQYEIALIDAFGPGHYVALRPGFFNTNVKWWGEGMKQGEVRIAFPHAKNDWNAPSDIGKVAAAFLSQTEEATTQKPAIVLAGPDMLTMAEGFSAIGKVLGKDIKTTRISQEENVKDMLGLGLPEAECKRMVKVFAELESPNDEVMQRNRLGAENMKKYTGTPTTVEQWATENKALFV